MGQKGTSIHPPIHPPIIPTLYSIFCSRLVFGISQAIKKLLLAQRPEKQPVVGGGGRWGLWKNSWSFSILVLFFGICMKI